MHRRLENQTVDPSLETVELNLRPLGGEIIEVRPRSSDVWVLRDVFLRGSIHLPPPQVAGDDLGVIWDLGANVGLTMADMAVRYPSARLYGVELDEANVELARRNLAAWRDRCTVVHGAVWERDGEISYAALPTGHELAFSATDEPRGGTRQAPAWSLGTLFDRYTPEGRIDYVKIDIEGAERQVLKAATGWPVRVRALQVEVHGEYAVDECARDLEALGFETTVFSGEHGPVSGVRASAGA